MNLDFDLESVTLTEFGVGLDESDGQRFCTIPIDASVQVALQEMAATTWRLMIEQNTDPETYNPSEKYASSEYVYLPLNNPLAQHLRELHEAANLGIDSGALSDPTKIFCYFARMTDTRNRRLTAIRRSSQFKGVLKSRLIHLLSDAMKLICDPVFRLDNDFDLLIDSMYVHILRPSGFESIGKLQDEILAVVPSIVSELQSELEFVDFANVADYARDHHRAARCLASIRAQDEASNINRQSLMNLCRDTGVEVQESNGRVTIQRDSVMDFLEVLDRRRYRIDLVEDSPERFKAASRQKIDR